MAALIIEAEVIKSMVQAACRAPSLHNIQPWRWVTDGARLQLFLDPSRVLPSDRSGRESVIGCGAALDHLRVVAVAAGLRTTVERFPNPNDPDHLASIEFSPMVSPTDSVTDGHRRRADAIWVRHSDRLPFGAPSNWAAFEPVLRDRLDHYRVQLDVLSEDARPRLAEATRLAESLRLYDSEYHAELNRWTGPFKATTGIPYSALPSASEADRVDVGRDFPVAPHHERRTRIPEDQSRIAVLSTTANGRADALATGEALSAVLLECTVAGLATCPLSHLTEMRATRDIVAALVPGDVVPQVLIRMGHAPTTEQAPPATARRPVEEVLQLTG